MPVPPTMAAAVLMAGFSRHPVVPHTATPTAGLPAYDSGAYCKQLAGSGVDFSGAIFNASQQQEQAAYSQLKAEWDQFAPQTRRYCVQVASVGTSGSYVILGACVAGETQAKQPVPQLQQ